MPLETRAEVEDVEEESSEGDRAMDMARLEEERLAFARERLERDALELDARLRADEDALRERSHLLLQRFFKSVQPDR